MESLSKKTPGTIPVKVYHRFLEHFLRQLRGFALLVTEKGHIVDCIGHSEEVTGYKRDEWIGKNIREFIFDGTNNEWTTNQHSDKPARLLIKKKDGAICICELHIVSFAEDGLFGMLLKESPVKEGARNDSFITLERLKQLAAEVAHEIRNPLTSLQGFIQLLRANPGRFHEYVQVIEDEIQQIELITAELLLLAKPQEFHFKKTDIVAIVDYCLHVMEGGAYQREVEFVREFEQEAIWIVCDSQKIKQVFINLFKNALEAMERPGQIVVQIKNSEDYVYITIIDQGIGIPENMLAMITEPFFTTKPQGSGLGLMICKKIIEEHKGYMDIHSEEGRGTTLTIGLPHRPTESVAKKRELF